MKINGHKIDYKTFSLKGGMDVDWRLLRKKNTKQKRKKLLELKYFEIPKNQIFLWNETGEKDGFNSK